MVIDGRCSAGYRVMDKVLLVDDQTLVRNGLKRILNQETDIDVVGECDDGDQVVDAVINVQPTVVLMDVRMKRMDGISATKAIQALSRVPPVMMLTTFGDDEVLWDALTAGAAGFVLKDASTDELIRATHVIAAGGAWLDPAVKFPSRSAPSTEIETLTAREREVLLLIAEGLTNHEITDRLCVSEATVKTHISHIFSKLDARDRAAAIVFAYDHGLVVPRR